jgi:hypothetical protein
MNDLKKGLKSSMVAYICDPHTQEAKAVDLKFKPELHSKILSQKLKKNF